MAYQKRQPKIMSDGNIARVGMIVYSKNLWIVTRINTTAKKHGTDDNTVTILFTYGHRGMCNNLAPCWYTNVNNLRKATLEEKKQYWAELAQK